MSDLNLNYHVVLEPDHEVGGFTVNCPALPGCVSEGETEAEALTNIREAIALYVTTLVEDGLPVPDDIAPPEVVQVTVKIAA